MEQKDFFKQNYESHLEEMRAQLSDADLIYIDSCSLMDPFMPLLAEHMIPVLTEQKKKLIVIESVLNELKTIKRPMHNPRTFSREVYAYTGLYTLKMFSESSEMCGFSILDFQSVPDEIKGCHADAAFEALIGMKSISNKIIIITQDKNLTEAILKLSESGATMRKPIRVYKISHLADEQGFLTVVKKNKVDKNVKRTSPKALVQQKTVPQHNPKPKTQSQPKPQNKPEPKPQVMRTFTKTPDVLPSEQLKTQDAKSFLKDTELHVPSSYRAVSRVQLREITAAYLPNTIVAILTQAFIDCDKLMRIALPDSLQVIEGSAFQRCRSLHSVTVPSSVKRIDSSAFKDCTSLTSITLGNGLTDLGSSVFANCVALTDIAIPHGVKRIDTMAFKGCKALKNVKLSEGLEEIGASAFSCCTSLTSLIIPRSVNSIAATAFSACPSLVLFCHRGSYAHQFAQERGIKHQVI